MLVLGLVGLARQRAATWVLASGEREDINLEGVLRHSAADALSSIGVVVAGAVLLASGWNAIDPLVSLVIAALIAAGSWRLLKEPFDVLMEAAPAGIDVGEVGQAMAEEADVVEVHDLHVWSVTSGFPALSAHVVVRRGNGSGPGSRHGSRSCSRALRHPAHHAPGRRVGGAIELIDLESAGIGSPG